MSKKYNEFIDELQQLCVKHKVQICASGYEGIEVWDLKADEPPFDTPIYYDVIEDRTNGEDE